jgi:DNA-binding GntR family transcriptional regulator
VTDQRRLDGRFYIELAACAQSVRLTLQEMDLHLELGQLPWAPAVEPDLLDAVVTGHRAVVAAIGDRDAGRARELAEEHVELRTVWALELRLHGRAGLRTAGAAAPRTGAR